MGAVQNISAQPNVENKLIFSKLQKQTDIAISEIFGNFMLFNFSEFMGQLLEICKKSLFIDAYNYCLKQIQDSPDYVDKVLDVSGITDTKEQNNEIVKQLEIYLNEITSGYSTTTTNKLGFTSSYSRGDIILIMTPKIKGELGIDV